MRDRAVLGVVDDYAGGLPIAIGDLGNFKLKRFPIEGDALGAAIEQHRLAIFQPELLRIRALGGSEVVEHILVVDDAVLENLDKGRA